MYVYTGPPAAAAAQLPGTVLAVDAALLAARSWYVSLYLIVWCV